MKKLFAMLTAVMLSAAVLTSCAGQNGDNNNPINDAVQEEPITFTKEEIISEMGLGWNLGNTLDATEGETAWGQPETTEEMIDKIKELGFDTIRIPVSWGHHVSSKPEYTIDEEWMDRVQTVVDWAIENDMFVIINAHHDNDYYYPSVRNSKYSLMYIEAVWTQIAERFKDYDQRLIFEGMNEPRPSGTPYEWGFDPKVTECVEAADIINQCNQKFVDVVRASGGNNTDRFLMATPYAASPYAAFNDHFKLPDDPSDRIILSVHAYTPYDVCMSDDMSKTKIDDSSRGAINDFIDKLYVKFVEKGTPVIIGECGITNKNNQEERRIWGEYFVSKAKDNGMMCVLWDNGNTYPGAEAYGLFDKENLSVFPECQEYYEGLFEGLNNE